MSNGNNLTQMSRSKSFCHISRFGLGESTYDSYVESPQRRWTREGKDSDTDRWCKYLLSVAIRFKWVTNYKYKYINYLYIHKCLVLDETWSITRFDVYLTTCLLVLKTGVPGRLDFSLLFICSCHLFIIDCKNGHRKYLEHLS